jgi:hypothetical protein
MNTDGPRQPQLPTPAPRPGDPSIRSGEGAHTALEALIRKRKEAERPDRNDGPPRPPALP